MVWGHYHTAVYTNLRSYIPACMYSGWILGCRGIYYKPISKVNTGKISISLVAIDLAHLVVYLRTNVSGDLGVCCLFCCHETGRVLTINSIVRGVVY